MDINSVGDMLNQACESTKQKERERILDLIDYKIAALDREEFDNYRTKLVALDVLKTLRTEIANQD